MEETLNTVFIEEASELVEEMMLALQAWMQEPNNLHCLIAIQRQLHTLKGSARFAQQLAIAQVAHDLETIFVRLHELQAKPSRAYLRRLKHILALLQQALLYLRQGHALDMSEMAQQVAQLNRTQLSADKMRTTGVAKELKATYKDFIRIPTQDIDTIHNLCGEMKTSRLQLSQEVLDLQHHIQELERRIAGVKEYNRLLTKNRDGIQRLLSDKEGDIQNLLIRSKRFLEETSGDFANLLKYFTDTRVRMEKTLLQQVNLQKQIEQRLMQSRMMSIGKLMPRFQKMVLQTARLLKKEVVFQVGSIHCDIDRVVMDKITPLLEHLLRNAIDHGIESKEQRLRQGKSVVGKIWLNMYQQGSSLTIEVQDDGCGINLQLVGEKALQKGLLSLQSHMTEKDILNFILLPYFSTRDRVTEISGRGVGLDIVSEEIKKLGGLLSISTQRGEGTTFSITLPSTICLNRVLLFELHQQLFAMPLSSIKGITRLPSEQLAQYLGPEAPAFRYAEHAYRVQYLGGMLATKWGQMPGLQSKTQALILLDVSGIKLGLLVDRLVGCREIVIRPLGQQFQYFSDWSGAFTLADGSVVLVLNPLTLVMRLQDKLYHQPHLPAEAELPPVVNEPLLLLVDDSITVRKFTKQLLERQGYRVLTAKDGLEALQRLSQQLPDMVILDLEMPRMDGLELLASLRHQSRFNQVPVLIVSSRMERRFRRRARALGAVGFLHKPCSEAKLLTRIKTHLLQADHVH